MKSRKVKMQQMIKDGKTYEEIGEINGITRQRVSQIVKPKKRNWKTDYWRRYKRHYYHRRIAKHFPDCEACVASKKK